MQVRPNTAAWNILVSQILLAIMPVLAGRSHAFIANYDFASKTDSICIPKATSARGEYLMRTSKFFGSEFSGFNLNYQ